MTVYGPINLRRGQIELRSPIAKLSSDAVQLTSCEAEIPNRAPGLPNRPLVVAVMKSRTWNSQSRSFCSTSWPSVPGSMSWWCPSAPTSLASYEKLRELWPLRTYASGASGSLARLRAVPVRVRVCGGSGNPARQRAAASSGPHL